MAKVVNDIDAVERYYDEWTGRYLEVYGDMIQAFRSADDKDTLSRIANSIGFKPGEHVLDAGCGVGGPARFFAKQHNVTLEGLTLSQVQVDTAKEKNIAAGLDDKINIRKGDFHLLTGHFHRERFDKVLFLESLGHSKNPEEVLKGAFEVLKPGGHVYIKDFYAKESDDPEYQAYIDRLVNNINVAYSYNTLDLNVVLKAMRRAGFEVEYIRPVPIEHDVQVRTDFESKFGIDLFEGGLDFPYADWLEIKCWKPSYQFKKQQQFADAALQSTYNKQGFVTTPLLNADEVKLLGDWYKAHEPESNGQFQVTLEVKDEAYRKEVDTLLKQVVAPKVKAILPGYRAIFGSFVVKPMGAGGIKQMHSDWQYTDETKQPSFGIWVPLMDVNEENGALLFVPGSHHHATLLRGQNTQNVYSIIEPLLKADRVVTVPQPAGEAAIFDHRTIHGSGENFTIQPRLAIAITMAPENADLIHLYRDPTTQAPHCMTKYVVPESFYLNYDLTQPPHEKYKAGEIIDEHFDSVIANLKAEYGKGTEPLFEEQIRQRPIARRRMMIADTDQKTMEEEGYLIREFLTEEEKESLCNLFNADTAGLHLPMAPTTWSKNEEYRDKIYNEIKRIFLPKLNELLQDYVPISGAFIIKNPSPNSALHTHFDWNFVDERRYTAIHVWVPLVDVNEQNGAYMILPQSHKMVNAWRGQNTPDSVFFGGRKVKAGVQKTLPMMAGEALLYDIRLIHGTPPNLSDSPRLAAGLVMIPKEATPIHIYTPEEKMYDKEVEVYAVDEAYYSSHDIKIRPLGYPYLGKVMDTQREAMFQKLEEVYLEKQPSATPPVETPGLAETHDEYSILDKIKRKVWG